MHDDRFNRVQPGTNNIFSPYEETQIKAQIQGIVDDNTDNLDGVWGRASVMNRYAIVTLTGDSTNGGKNLLLDKEEQSEKWYDKDPEIDARNPSVSNLMIFAERDNHKSRPYSYQDFAFLKQFGKIGNNRLVTLRRYAAPTTDSLDFPGMSDKNAIFPPIAQACTYITNNYNKVNDFFKIHTSLPWEDLEAAMHDISPPSDTGAGALGGKRVSGVAKMLSVASGQASASSVSNAGVQFADPYESGPYLNRVKGPVNRIDTVKKRKPGLKMEQKFSVTFEYEARSFGATNAKAIMLDIISNMYALTYGSAPFWGGENRFRTGGNAYPLKGMMQKYYQGDAVGLMNQGINTITDSFKSLSSFTDIFKNGKFNLETLSNLATKGANFGLSMLVSGKKDTFLGANALLTGIPVGEWHLTIGNPLNPMMEIGNLVCTDMTIEVGEELGPDDFPTTIRFIVELEHGMPRDADAIESMFNGGKGRVYKIPESILSNLPSLSETTVDTNTGQNHKINNSKQSLSNAARVQEMYANARNSGEVGLATVTEAAQIMRGVGQATPIKTS